MGLKKYKATVTFLSSELKHRADRVTVDIFSSEPVTVSDPALLNAFRALPANSVITSVSLQVAA